MKKRVFSNFAKPVLASQDLSSQEKPLEELPSCSETCQSLQTSTRTRKADEQQELKIAVKERNPFSERQLSCEKLQEPHVKINENNLQSLGEKHDKEMKVKKVLPLWNSVVQPCAKVVEYIHYKTAK